MPYSELEIAGHLAAEVSRIERIMTDCPADEAILIEQVRDYMLSMLDEMIDQIPQEELAGSLLL